MPAAGPPFAAAAESSARLALVEAIGKACAWLDDPAQKGPPEWDDRVKLSAIRREAENLVR